MDPDEAESLFFLRERVTALAKGRMILVLNREHVERLVKLVDKLEEENEILRMVTGAQA